MAQLVIAAAGAAISVAIPGVGGAIAAFAFTTIANALFAPTIKSSGPRLSDLKVSGTEQGQPIPYFEGKVRTSGQIAWSSDRREIATTTEQGKGGGAEYTTYTYEVDMLYLLSDCEMANLARVWSNGKLVYNNLPNATIGTAVASETTELWRRITFYSGSDTQLPDATYEAAVGIGNAPAYRGRATVFIEGLQLGGSGQIPNLSFEVFRQTTLADASLSFGSFARPAVAHRAAAVYKNTAWYVYSASGGANPYTILKSNKFGDFKPHRVVNLNFRYAGFDPVFVQTNGNPQFVWCSFNGAVIANGFNIEALDVETGVVTGVAAYVPASDLEVCRPVQRRVAYDEVQRVYVICGAGINGLDPDSPFIFKVAGNAVSRCPTITGLNCLAAWNGHIYALANSGGFWRVRRYNYAGTYVDEVVDTAGALAGSDLIPNGSWIRVDSDGQCWVFSPYHGRLFKITTVFQEVSTPANAQNYNTNAMDGVFYCEEGFAAFGYEEAGSAPFDQSFTFRRFKCPTAVQPTLQSVVERLCARADLEVAQYDASGLSTVTRPVRSLAISQTTPIRQVLETLATAYYFGCTTSDKLYFRARGGSSVASIPHADLGVGEGSAQEEPLSLKLANDLETPAQIALSYTNVDGDYNVATEYSDRLLVGQTSTSAIPLPLGFQPAEAKGTVDSMVADAAAAIFTTSISLGSEYARLEPTDVVTVTDRDGSNYRLRVRRKVEAGPVLTLDLVLDDASALTTTGITSTAYTQSSTVAGTADTLLRLLDIPILRDSDDDVGIYVAAAGDSVPWPGAAIFKSPDDSVYASGQSINDAAGLGSTTTALTTWSGGFVFDETSSVTVSMSAGTLSSYTRDQIFDGSAPAYLIGSEIVYARSATLVSAGIYTLTGFLRGLRGTEWAMAGHAAVENFTVLSSSGIRRETMTTGEISALRYFKAPTLGRPLSTATAQSITLAAVGKKPFAPVGLRAQRVGDSASSSNVLLLHAEGTNGSTTFTDSSPVGRSMTAFGSAQISTAQAKFGASSILFNGTTAYTTAATGADFQFPGDFTVEAWIYVTPAGIASSAGPPILDTRASAGSATGFTFYQLGSGLNLYTDAAVRITSTGVLTENTWAHVALCRSGTSIRAFVNGVQVGSTYTSSANFSDGRCFIGRNAVAATDYFDGYIDEHRITKNIARYTSNFSVPNAAFPEEFQTTISWDRRTRLAKNFTNGYVPLGETSEFYSVDVWSDNTYAVLKRTITCSTPSANYTNAQQTADFGSVPATLYLDVYQVSAVVGRGYRLRGSV